MNEKIITGIYIRVSTEDQAKDGFSIHAQRDKLTKYAEANDWNIHDYYIDDGISGKNLEGRPEVKRMLDDIKNRKINNILIYKLDRLTRSTKDLIYLIELFENYNCTFNSQTEKIDTSNAVGRMFVKIIGIFAEFERENLAERVSFGYEQKTREGHYTNCNGVYGYDYIVGEKKLIVNELEKEIVNRVFDEYIDGKSYLSIAKTFNMENISTKRGGKWASSTIKSILHNPLYLGKVRYGVTKKLKDRSFIVDGNNIEPIVEEAKWNRANDIAKIRKHHSVRRYPSENSYYFHIIKCGMCGGNISARQQTKDRKIYITYKCNNSKRGFCECKGFSQNKINDSFSKYLETLKKIKPDKSILKRNDVINDNNKKINSIKMQITKLNNRKKKIRTQFIDELLNIDDYKKMNDEIDKYINNFNNTLVNIKKSLGKISDKYTFEEIKDLISNIKLNWDYLNNKERQQFLERFVENIKVIKKNDSSKLIIDSVKFKSR